ncbi:hypothetical protein ACI2KG_00785 [Pseudomonas sp. NPDC089407]|uniref:hypothetical protein n=1 Tax=Pseudomonas sp. NPDC089407 TaxID=3364464 RepID=UPI003850A1EB
MPTENRSSSNKLAILPTWVIDRIKEEMRLGPATWQAITDAVEQAEVPQALPCEVKLPPGTVIDQGYPLSTLLMAIAQRARQPAHAQVFNNEPPARQPHPEPIAWMVSTAIWWTKEEAERDAAATGLPIVGLGPMTGAASAEQQHGEPVAIVTIGTNDKEVIEPLSHDLKVGTELYTRADPGEVERLRAALKFYADRDHFAEDIGSDWDSVSGEPANVLWHEQEAWFVEDGSIARAALERQP